MAEHDEFGAFLIGFIIGGLTGAAISLMMAPQSGEETREFLRERAIELRERGTEMAQTATEQVGSTADEVRNRAADIRQRGQVVLEEQRDRLSSTVQNLRSRLPGEDEAAI
jgi:gas vesicle protein